MTIEDKDKKLLIDLARNTIFAHIKGDTPPTADLSSGLLLESRGCFVTITNAGQLRGCIGTFHPNNTLGKMIIQMAQSASNDPRFVNNPITPAELPDLTIEVSILSPLTLTKDPEGLILGEHGIYIVANGFSGCFLPEVATDQGWSVEEFLGFCCSHKAGLSYDAWRNPETDVYLFTSEKFAE